jgi:hypothetical protein
MSAEDLGRIHTNHTKYANDNRSRSWHTEGGQIITTTIGGGVRSNSRSFVRSLRTVVSSVGGNLAYINSQGIVSLFVNQTTTTSHFSIGWCDCTHGYDYPRISS